MQNQTLTRSEMTVMNILWEMPDGGTVYDVLAKYEEPKLAYTTTATFMKILEKKGYLESRKLSGRTYTYFPLISKEEYSRRAMQEVKKDLFDGSAKSLLSFFVQEEGLTAEAFRVVKSMPKWPPGKQDGQLVRVGYALPFRFQLKGQDQGAGKEKEAARTNPISDGPYSADMLYIYDGNVVEFEAIKDLPPTEIAIGNIQVLKSCEIYEEYLSKHPKARNGVVIMNSYSRRDQLWVVDGVPMTGEEMEVKYANDFPVQFQQLRKDAETLAKYSQYPAAKNGVNIVFTKKN